MNKSCENFSWTLHDLGNERSQHLHKHLKTFWSLIDLKFRIELFCLETFNTTQENKKVMKIFHVNCFLKLFETEF